MKLDDVAKIIKEVTTKEASLSFRKNEDFLKRIGVLGKIKAEIAKILGTVNLSENLRDSFFLMAIYYETINFSVLNTEKTSEGIQNLKNKLIQGIPERLSDIYDNFKSYITGDTVEHPGMADDDDSGRSLSNDNSIILQKNQKVLLYFTNLIKSIVEKYPNFEQTLADFIGSQNFKVKLANSRINPYLPLEDIFRFFLNRDIIINLNELDLDNETKKYFIFLFHSLRNKFSSDIRDIQQSRQ